VPSVRCCPCLSTGSTYRHCPPRLTACSAGAHE
jgi:hypothetical protein